MGDPGGLYLRDGDGFVGTILTQGSWDPDAQNGAVVLALLGHCLEDVPTLTPMVLARLTVDLVRPVPIGRRLVVRPTIEREGKKIQLVRLELLVDDVVHVWATALRLRVLDVSDVAHVLGTTPIEAGRSLPPPDQCVRTHRAPGSPGFVEAIEMRRVPGRGLWVRLAVPVVAGEAIRATSRLTVGFDFAQLINADLEHATAAMTLINPDVTAHVLRPPAGDWTAVTGATSFEAALGRGVSSATLADERGVFAVASTSQLLQPR
jgi:hypothetical protein